ncbi:tetratricopeptide repeat protein [Luteibacter sp. UNCMF366Tsu5.1]|uniref:tetratricopeptide repeat protein n=1 Tax=Luteibacter sp. UNCMF366Tsu5.1 TaxID=1502758 RepID=UPI00090888DE|nr:tetratricopeptide repeat protein [Luteibacter sp. UNCMF366Tsu5.1]SFW25198.1 LPXTG-motif cell wall anchor domain-containing protein [Luteibacter sp. UNCMF366Tsu5.1]
MKKLMLFLVLLCLATAASAADSPKDVQAAIDRGDYATAETLLRQAVSEHPSSAKAHYVLAEVLAHQGNIGEAKAEATKASSLDPATHFTDPAKFQAFQRKLDAALGTPGAKRPLGSLRSIDAPQAPAVAAPVAATTGGSSHLGLVIVGGIALLLIFFLMRRRRDAVPPATAYPPPPVNGQPPYGGYGGNGPYGAYPPPAPAHSGVGTAVAAGLGGVAAGMLLDEALRGHGESGLGAGGDPRAAGTFVDQPTDPTGQAYDDLRDDPIDMGNDDASWDDSSSSSDDDSW